MSLSTGESSLRISAGVNPLTSNFSVVELAPTPSKKKVFRPRVIGKYSFREKVGEGGSGAVYKCTHPTHSRPIAVKKLKLRDSLEIRTPKIDNELKCLLACQGHPGIVRVHDVLRTNKHCLLVTDLAKRDLFAFITQGGPVGVESAREIFYNLALAVQHMHTMSIAHRDLKPENILLDDSDRPVICDFGFALKWDEADGLRTDSKGTIRCMPPEMLPSPRRIAKHNPFHADMWCLGTILFFMLSGLFPFDTIFGQGDSAVKANILRGEFLNPLPSHAQEAQSLIEGLLQPTPSRRLTIDQVVMHPFFAKATRRTSLGRASHEM